MRTYDIKFNFQRAILKRRKVTSFKNERESYVSIWGQIFVWKTDVSFFLHLSRPFLETDAPYCFYCCMGPWTFPVGISANACHRLLTNLHPLRTNRGRVARGQNVTWPDACRVSLVAWFLTLILLEDILKLDLDSH